MLLIWNAPLCGISANATCFAVLIGGVKQIAVTVSVPCGEHDHSRLLVQPRDKTRRIFNP